MITQVYRIRRYAVWAAVFWTAVLAASFSWYYRHEQKSLLDIARAEARATYEKDALYRRWATSHGGVYVPVSAASPPSPYLAGISERDLTTPSGRALTLVNPAYMTRQVYEMANQSQNLVRGHLTSLRPIRPENEPDPWEAAALRRLETGGKEVSEVQTMQGRKYMRLMRPFVTEQGCLKCHEAQGYRVGDLRGGVSASVPLDLDGNFAEEAINGAIITHGLLWFLGIGMIGAGARTLSGNAAALLASEERYRTVADYTADWEFWQALDRSFRYVSPSCLQVCGYSHEDFYADPGLMYRVIHPDDLEGYLTHIHASQGGNPQPIDLRIVRRGGEVRWISHVCQPVYDTQGRQIGVRASNRDVTGRKKAEAALKEKTALLEHEVRERKEREADLEGKNAELERFTYTVSHDLKSPLITIKGFAGAVLHDLAAGRHNRLDLDLRRIMGAADKMSGLLNDLLELSRVGRMVNPATPVDMNQLAREVVGQLDGALSPGQVEIELQEAIPSVKADRQRLSEVLQNLIENAVKYMGDQPRPRIEIGWREEQGERLFFVRDNGMGIAPQYRETVFGLFNQLDAKSEGSGIGLALARRIVEFHGGRIWVESDGLGCGSTFCFTLSRKQPLQAATNQSQGGDEP